MINTDYLLLWLLSQCLLVPVPGVLCSGKLKERGAAKPCGIDEMLEPTFSAPVPVWKTLLMYITFDGNPCSVNGFRYCSAPFYDFILSKFPGSVSCTSWCRNWEEALGMAARWERLSSSKIGHPDASLIKISRLVFPWSLGSDKKLSCCLPGHRLPFSSKELLSHPCHCSHSWASAKAEQEQLQRCVSTVSPCEWAGHKETLKQCVTRALRFVVR